MNARLLYQLNRCTLLCRPRQTPTRSEQFFLLLCQIFPLDNPTSTETLDKQGILFKWAEKLTASKSRPSKRVLEAAAQITTGNIDLDCLVHLCRLYSKSLTLVINEFIIDLNNGSDDNQSISWGNGKYTLLDSVDRDAHLSLTSKGKLYSIGTYSHGQLKKALCHTPDHGDLKKKDAYLALQNNINIVHKVHPYLFLQKLT